MRALKSWLNPIRRSCVVSALPWVSEQHNLGSGCALIVLQVKRARGLAVFCLCPASHPRSWPVPVLDVPVIAVMGGALLLLKQSLVSDW